MMELKATKILDIRFSEVDSMNVVWHGSYPLYFEDARELFGEKYDLTYQGFFNHGYFAPLVELSFQYKKPIRYGTHPCIEITYRPTAAAKIVFDYKIFCPEDN
jgi:acyl-CoA thioester hydrolase